MWLMVSLYQHQKCLNKLIQSELIYQVLSLRVRSRTEILKNMLNVHLRHKSLPLISDCVIGFKLGRLLLNKKLIKKSKELSENEFYNDGSIRSIIRAKNEKPYKRSTSRWHIVINNKQLNAVFLWSGENFQFYEFCLNSEPCSFDSGYFIATLNGVSFVRNKMLHYVTQCVRARSHFQDET